MECEVIRAAPTQTHQHIQQTNVYNQIIIENGNAHWKLLGIARWIWVALHIAAVVLVVVVLMLLVLLFASFPLHVIRFEFVIDSIVYVIIKSALKWWGHFSNAWPSNSVKQFLLLNGKKFQFPYNQQTISYIVSFIWFEFIYAHVARSLQIHLTE